jgi:glycosyltransferase involved in cell wall biosynthesis
MADQSFIILTPGFPVDENDSTCLPMQQVFVQCLQKSHPGLRIIVLSFQYPYIKKSYSWNNIEVISFAGRNRGGFSKLIQRRKINSVLRKINHQTTIRGLLSFWYGECALIGKRFAARNNLKHFCWLLGQDARIGNSYVKLIPPTSHELIALSDFLQEEFEHNHRIRPEQVIPPGLLSSQFIKTDESRDIDILSAGSLIPLKRYNWLPEMIAVIKTKIPTLKVVLAGKGPEQDRLYELIAQHNLTDNFTFTGELSYPEVLALMQRTKVFLHPSSYEGFSGVCLEALGAGAKVISFCKPMHKAIPNWKIVSTKEEMIRETELILQNPAVSFKSTMPYRMEDTVQQVGNLFGF